MLRKVDTMAHKDNETKRLILTRAMALIKEKGFDQVTLNDICAASEVSKHTFYYYFQSKEDLLRDFFELPKEVTASRLTSILSAEHHIDKYWNLTEPIVEFFEKMGPEIARRIVIANINRDLGTFDTSRRHEALHKAEETLLKMAYESGEIRNSTSVSDLRKVVFLQAMGLVAKWCMSNGSFDLKASTRSAMEIALDVEPSLRKGAPLPF